MVVYFSRLGRKLRTDQELMLVANAKDLARIKHYDFGGTYREGHSYSGHVYFVPEDTLLLDEASHLGIRGPDDLYGGVVPYPFAKTKAITHQLVDDHAERPDGWSSAFAEQVRNLVLPGYTVFSAHDAKAAAERIISRTAVRVKAPLATGGKGQALVTSVEELDAFVKDVPADDIATYGLVLEENLQQVRTLSIGHITVDKLTITYHGTQRFTTDNDGRSVYGGSDLVCVRGGWGALDRLSMTDKTRVGVAEAARYNAPAWQPLYFVGAIPYVLVQRLLVQAEPDSLRALRNNIITSFDFGWRLAGGTRVYGELLVDDIHARSGKNPNKLGYQAGWEGVAGVGTTRLTWGVELTRLTRFVYTSFFGRDYANLGQPLGFPTGPDARRLRLRAGWDLGPDWQVGLVASRTDKGENEITEPFIPRTPRVDSFTFEGTVQKTRDLQLALRWWPASGIDLSVQGGYQWLDNAGHVAGAKSQGARGAVELRLNR